MGTVSSTHGRQQTRAFAVFATVDALRAFLISTGWSSLPITDYYSAKREEKSNLNANVTYVQ
jgi:hypothetical protein